MKGEIIMNFHELANIFPMLGEEELKELCADMEKNGLTDPIIVYEGKVLDGRNRATACEMLGIKPKTVEYTGNDPLAFVLSKNLHRRHLNESQRAVIAATLATMRQGERTDLPTFGKFAEGSQDIETKEVTAQNCAISQQTAAKMLNVSERQVRNATKLRKEAAPEVIQQVKEGKKSLHAALSERKAKPTEKPRRKTIAQEPETEELQFLKIPLPFRHETAYPVFDKAFRHEDEKIRNRIIAEMEALASAIHNLND